MTEPKIGLELYFHTMWPADYESLRQVGSVVRYYDKKLGIHVEAKIVKIQLFNEVFGDSPYGGLYFYLDNDIGIHEDQCRVIVP